MKRAISFFILAVAPALATTSVPLAVSPTSLSFSYDPSGTKMPATQNLTVTTTPSGVMYTATPVVATPAGALWLTVAPSSGLSPGALKVLVNPTGLPYGTYTGQIVVASNGATVTVAVTLLVKAPPVSITVSPATLNIPYQAGTALPASIPITLSGSGSFLSFTATASATGGWLKISQASGLIFSAFPLTLNAAVDPTNLVPGTYKGTIVISAPQAVTPTTTINVLLTVTPGVPVITTSWPASVDTGSGNNTMTINGADFYSGSVVKANTGGADTVLASTFLGTNAMTAVIPASMTAATGTIFLRVSNPAPAGDSNIISISVLPPGPRISSIGIVSGASMQGGTISPGEIITIFGTGLGPSAIAFTSGASIGATVGGTQVLFGATAAPVIYAQANQLSAIVPYGLAGAPSSSITVTNGGATSNAVVLPVVEATPAFFTLDSSGTGPAAALNQDMTLNSALNPAARGSVVVLYLTGEGQTNPAGVDGQFNGVTNLPVPVLPATVTVGGYAATIQYIGGAPTLTAGICQLNVKIPDQAPTGVAVPVKIVFNGASVYTSPAGPTIAIQ